MTYKENPKTKGSGIICSIPQTGTCPRGCPDCFFQSGRSYLRPLGENLPNTPSRRQAWGRVVRINDGHDSGYDIDSVIKEANRYKDVFLNTSKPEAIEKFKGYPFVLTVNPGLMTDTEAHLIPEVPNLMFVRVRVNTWNMTLVDLVVEHYRCTPVILTFMAYYTEKIPATHVYNYAYRKRTLNSYWVITQEAWDRIVDRYKSNPYVYTCGKDAHTHECSRCGNCLREYYNTKERLRGVL